MERRFGVHEPQISLAARRLRRPHLRLRLRPHRHRARTPAHRRVLPARPRTPPRLPAHPARVRHHAPPGARPPPTRPLRYAPYVDGAADTAAGTYRLTFAGGPGAGAQFLVTSANRTDAPWTYTTAAGASVADTWNTRYSKGTTDLTVHGPNGFLRRFRNPGTTPAPR
ncbi:phospholipase domain-containing protein [Streptomyces zhihengii]